MAAHSIPNIFYILRKDMTEADRREVLLRLCKILRVEGIDRFKIVSALDKKDFMGCSIPAITANELLHKL